MKLKPIFITIIIISMVLLYGVYTTSQSTTSNLKIYTTSIIASYPRTSTTWTTVTVSLVIEAQVNFVPRLNTVPAIEGVVTVTSTIPTTITTYTTVTTTYVDTITTTYTTTYTTVVPTTVSETITVTSPTTTTYTTTYVTTIPTTITSTYVSLVPTTITTTTEIPVTVTATPTVTITDIAQILTAVGLIGAVLVGAFKGKKTLARSKYFGKKASE